MKKINIIILTIGCLSAPTLQAAEEWPFIRLAKRLFTWESREAAPASESPSSDKKSSILVRLISQHNTRCQELVMPCTATLGDLAKEFIKSSSLPESEKPRWTLDFFNPKEPGTRLDDMTKAITDIGFEELLLRLVPSFYGQNENSPIDKYLRCGYCPRKIAPQALPGA
jgi:hypothetical protein